DGIRDRNVTGVQTCALPILAVPLRRRHPPGRALPNRPSTPGRRRRTHPPTHRRTRPQPRHPGRIQPRLETGRHHQRLGTPRTPGQLPHRTTPRGRRRARQHPRTNATAVHRPRKPSSTPPGGRTHGFRRRQPPPDRKTHRDRHPLRLRRRPPTPRPPPTRHRTHPRTPLRPNAPRPRTTARPDRETFRDRLGRPDRPRHRPRHRPQQGMGHTRRPATTRRPRGLGRTGPTRTTHSPTHLVRDRHRPKRLTEKPTARPGVQGVTPG